MFSKMMQVLMIDAFYFMYITILEPASQKNKFY